MKWLVLLLPMALHAQCWLAGEALLLRPSVERPYTTIVSPANSSVTPLGGRWEGNVKPSYSWGYRIGLGYRCGWFDGRASWSSWIHTDPYFVAVDAGERIWFIFIHSNAFRSFVSPGQLERRDQFRAQSIDAEGGICWGMMRGYAGLRYSRMRYNVNIDATGTPDFGTFTAIADRWRSDLLGVGPRIGIDVCCPLPYQLRLFGDISLAVLFASLRGRWQETVNNITTIRVGKARISPANVALLNPEARFGVGWCGAVVDLEIGYRISYLSVGAVRAQFYDANPHSTSEVTREPLALDGWNFRLGVHY